MITQINDGADRQTKPLEHFHKVRDVGKACGWEGENDFIDVFIPANSFCYLLQGIDRRVIHGNSLFRKTYIAYDPAERKWSAD